MYFRVNFIIACLAISLVGCNGGNMAHEKVELGRIQDVPASEWTTLSKKRIYFGHQSVGYNIMDGIRDIMNTNHNINLTIAESSNAKDLKDSFFAHSRVGKNMDPVSKIEDFNNIIENSLGENVDIAFFKFCYVDIHSGTDIEQVFNVYKSSISALQKKFPNITFVHVTVPLTANKGGIKRIVSQTKRVIKSILGKDDMYDNSIKARYNNLIRNTYSSSEPVFDLAKIESTYPDGHRTPYAKGDKKYYTLVPNYTNDGGHLNEKGRKIVAEQLLIFLANTIKMNKR